MQQLRLKLNSLLPAVLGRLPALCMQTLCCCSWRDGHVPNVNKRHAAGPEPACDPAPLSLHILALCLDCIRGLCWSMPLSRSILSSVRLNLSPYFRWCQPRAWRAGPGSPSPCHLLPLLFRRRREHAGSERGFRQERTRCPLDYRSDRANWINKKEAELLTRRHRKHWQPIRKPE